MRFSLLLLVGLGRAQTPSQPCAAEARQHCRDAAGSAAAIERCLEVGLREERASLPDTAARVSLSARRL